MRHHPGARARGDDDGERPGEDRRHMPSDAPSGVPVAGVERRLPATGLIGRKGHRAAKVLEHHDGRRRDVVEEEIAQARRHELHVPRGGRRRLRRHGDGGSRSTGLVSWPMPSISTDDDVAGLQPARRLSAAMPTPWGVPVKMTVPGSSVVLPLRNSMRRRQRRRSCRRWFQSCTRSPLRMVAIASALGLGISSGVTRPRAQRGEGVEGLAAAPLAAAAADLPVAGRHVVGAGVAEHVIERLLAAHVLAGPADDHGQLALVVDLVAGQVAAGSRSARRDR